MRRRDLYKAVLAPLADSPVAPQTTCVQPCYPPTSAEAVNTVPPAELSFPPGNVLRWGADPTGGADSTMAIQLALNVAWASGNYGSPWTGKGGATPVILFPPGRYRITDTLTVPTGVTLRGAGHPANTESHTRIIMDSPGTRDNRDKPILRFNRTTLAGAALMNAAVCSALQDLEFWYVTPGGTFDLPLHVGIAFGAYPNGGALMFDVDSTDTRIVNCVFQHAPSAVRIKGVPAGSSAKRGDGQPGNRGVGIFFENCEFDASCTHVYATGSELDLQFKQCQFYGAMHRYEGCTGKVVYQGGRWHGAAYVDAASVPNSLVKFELKGADIEIGAPAFIRLNKAKLIDISQNAVLGGTSADSWIEVTDADGGCILGNAIDNSGRSSSSQPGKPASIAAVRLRGCRHVLVASNNITATEVGTYNGFGILCEDGDRSSRGNFVNGNAVSAPYSAGARNGETRSIKVSAADVLGMNYSLASDEPDRLGQ